MKPKTVQFRRKREGRTNYLKRLKILHSGKPRLVVRFSNTRILGQLVEFNPEGDRILAAVDSSSLRKMGWEYSCRNMPAAYLTGMLLASKSKNKEAVLDVGFRTPEKGGIIYAFLKGAIDGGMNVPCSKDVFPSEERISGKHIDDYKPSNERQNAKYLKIGPIAEAFEKIRRKVAE